jgi:hypothetical protein
MMESRTIFFSILVLILFQRIFSLPMDDTHPSSTTSPARNDIDKGRSRSAYSRSGKRLTSTDKQAQKGKGIMTEEGACLQTVSNKALPTEKLLQAAIDASLPAQETSKKRSKLLGKIIKEELPEPIRHYLTAPTRKENESDASFQHRQHLQVYKKNYWTKKKEKALQGVPAQEQHNVWQSVLRSLQDQKNGTKMHRYCSHKAVEEEREKKNNSVPAVRLPGLSAAERQRLYRERLRLKSLLRENPDDEGLLKEAADLRINLNQLTVDRTRSGIETFNDAWRAREKEGLEEGDEKRYVLESSQPVECCRVSSRVRRQPLERVDITGLIGSFPGRLYRGDEPPYARTDLGEEESPRQREHPFPLPPRQEDDRDEQVHNELDGGHIRDIFDDIFGPNHD